MRPENTLRRGWLPLLAMPAMLILLRVFGLGLHSTALLIAEGLLAYLYGVLLGRSSQVGKAAAACAVTACLAWYLDLLDGNLAVVYGISGFLAALPALCRRKGLNPYWRAILSAFLIAGAVAFGEALLLTVTREMTPVAALTYAGVRQARPAVACLLGFLGAELWLKRFR